MTWIDALVQNLLAILNYCSPIRVIRVYERGVVFRWGRLRPTLDPGFHWIVPFRIDQVEIVTVIPEARNLLTQSVTTQDGVAVTFSVNVVFAIADAALMYTEVHDFHSMLDAVAMTHLAARIRAQEWVDLLKNQPELERSLRGTLTTRVKDWGAQIVSVGITDLVRAKPLRLFGDPPMR